MQDFLQKYTRHNIVSHLSILGVSLALAFGIYFFIGDSDVGNLIKTNVREASNNSEDNSGDIYLEADSSDTNNILVKSSKSLNKIKAVSLTFTYDSENLDIVDIKSLQDGASVQNLSNEDGISTVFLQYESEKDIVAGDYLLVLQTSKKSDKLQVINVSNGNFRDISGESYLLTTSGIDF